MVAGPQRPGDAASEFDYWLRRCEGFRGDAPPQGRVGFVEEVRYPSRCDRPDVIAVRAGLLGRLLLVLPVGDVAEILPGEELVVLQRSPRPTATERARDLRERVHAGRRRGAAGREVEGVGAGAKRIGGRQEVETVIERMRRLIGLGRRKGGEREMTPDIEESAEPSAEEASTEEQAGEESAADEAPAEGAEEAAPAEEPAAEEPPAEEQTTT
jgi:hypothetical protein